jgi:K+-sensing histidine kinase KdpD
MQARRKLPIGRRWPPATSQELDMSGAILDEKPVPLAAVTRAEDPRGRSHVLGGYMAALGLVAAATLVAFLVENLIAAPNLSLVFVLPVLVAALSFGWGPALVSAVAATLAFDIFFVEPRYSILVASPTDMWALSLLLVVAAISSTVAAQSRGRALEARLAVERAEALHSLAHLVVEAAPAGAVVESAGAALSRIFRAPAAVLQERGDRLVPVALAGGATLSAADDEAARWTLVNQVPTRADAFPFDAASFDFWPIRRGAGPGFVLGVGLTDGREKQPADPARYVELVGAYLAAGFSQDPSGSKAA